MRALTRLRVAVLALAVGLAFADASVVVLALPALYGEYDTTIVGVSWVITSYAVVVAAVGLALAAAGTGRSLFLTVTGLAAFAGSSAWCALAPSLGSLVAGRCLQGLGGALLLVGSHGLLHRLHPAGRRVWAAAGTVGLAVGPALGGVLTEWFEWRAIFAVQAPVAALALVVAFDRRARQAPVAVDVPAPPVGAGRVVLACLGLLGVSGGLVGALFLGVLLVIEVWQFSP
ncbi:MAG: MFS transporter, partial [Acidimicrobiia bacterium]